MIYLEREMKPLTLLKRLIFIPKCIACGELLEPIPQNTAMTYGKICFCNSCLAKWEKAKSETCRVCSKTADMCSCIPKYFKDLQGNIPSLCFYSPKTEKTQNRVILTLKKINDAEAFEFLSVELLPQIVKMLAARGIDGENCIFAWIPRKRSSIAKYGFDQGQKLCEAIAKGFGQHAYPLFRRLGGKEQKKLGTAEREANAEKCIVLNHAMIRFPKQCNENCLGSFLNQKCVVIIDDVFTTGATLKRGVELLKSEGVDTVIVACIAKSEAKI